MRRSMIIPLVIALLSPTPAMAASGPDQGAQVAPVAYSLSAAPTTGLSQATASSLDESEQAPARDLRLEPQKKNKTLKTIAIGAGILVGVAAIAALGVFGYYSHRCRDNRCSE